MMRSIRVEKRRDNRCPTSELIQFFQILLQPSAPVGSLVLPALFAIDVRGQQRHKPSLSTRHVTHSTKRLLQTKRVQSKELNKMTLKKKEFSSIRFYSNWTSLTLKKKNRPFLLFLVCVNCIHTVKLKCMPIEKTLDKSDATLRDDLALVQAFQ